jgi:hypothetical protein
MYDAVIGLLIAFGFLLLLLFIKNLAAHTTSVLASKLVEAGDKLVKKIEKISDIKIEMVSNGSDTTRLPYPANASSCSHLWEPIVEKVLENEDIKKIVYIQKCTMCGLIDKTIEEIRKDREQERAAVAATIPKSECRHEWQDSTVALESAFEQMRNRFSLTKKDLKDFNPWLFRKTLVKVLTCSHCGEVKTIIASNFDLGDQDESDA